MSERELVRYEPNPVLAFLYHRFFEHIEIDESWVTAVREADSRGTVVYVLRNLSFVDFFALDHLTKRLHLPQVRFANDLGLWILEPMGRGWFQALAPKSEEEDAQDLARALDDGSSAALFLKRPPSLLEPGARGLRQGDVFLRTLFDVQRRSKRPILLVPQVFVWSKRSDEAEHTLLDTVFGPREWPGKIRTVGQFLANYRHVTLRAGEPVDVKAFLEREASPGASDDVLVRRITYLLLRRLERERRAVVGPTKKPADRLRDEILRSPRLQKVVVDMAGEGAPDRRVMSWRALSMLREMEADLDISTIAVLDKVTEQVFARIFSALEVDEEGVERLRQAMKDGAVVLLPSHKSHIDYIVIAYVLYARHIQLPIIAAGDNLNFFPLGPVFRRAGAFFIRRSFRGDRLYGAVVDAYMRRLLVDGWSLEFFLEGGRSRTGKLLEPKLGLLSLVVDAAVGVAGKKLSFAPISIGYERLVEERAYVEELSGGEKKKEDVAGLLSSAGVLASRYGRVNIQFGEILTLEQILREFDAARAPARGASRANGGEEGANGGAALDKLTPARRRGLVTRLAYRVMNEINRVTAVTPGALVATALLTHSRRGIAHADLLVACRRLAGMLHAFGARFSPSLAHPVREGEIRDEAISEACELFARAGHLEVREQGGAARKARSGALARLRGLLEGGGAKAIARGPDAIYVVPDDERMSLDLAKNIVVHFFVSRAMVATPLLASGRGMDEAALKERVLALSRLFKHEFQFRADAPFDQIFEETLCAMAKDGEVRRDGDPRAVLASDGEGRERLVLHAQAVKSFVEGYRVAARSLTALLKGPMAGKDLAKRALPIGDRMFLAGAIERREALSRPVFENAYASFVDQGYLTRTDGKVALAPSYSDPETVETIERKIAGFLGERRGLPS